MKRGWIKFALIASSFLFLPSGCALAQKVTDNEEIRKSLKVAREDRQLVVDNISGEITVVGYDGETIELVAQRKIQAESREKIDEAKQAVTLDIKEEGKKVVIYVDAPWRCADGINYRGWHYYGYDVMYDLDLKVPRKISLYLKTVNHGKVTVKDIEGDCDVRNVNAGIEMSNINGPANVRTVNGPIEVTFSRNPASDCSFTTVNGMVEVVFQNGLNADLKLKTFNGHVYTDFDVEDLPLKSQLVEERSGRRKIFRRGDSYSVRAGKGGPEFSFDTLNGSIYILKQD